MQIVLSDLFPNISAFERLHFQSKNIRLVRVPIDARKVPGELQGLRTLLLAFYLFKPEDAKMILQDAVDTGNPIGVFEGQERNIKSFIGRVISPIFVI